MSRHGRHATAREAMEYVHHIHGYDVRRCGGTCFDLGGGMNHHATQGSGKKHKNMDETSHSNTMRHVGSQKTEKTKKCVLVHIFLSRKKGDQH